MKRVKYLNNRDLLKEIHKSKGTYSSYVADKDADYDIILPALSKINASSIAQARKNKAKKMTVTAWEEAKAQGQKRNIPPFPQFCCGCPCCFEGELQAVSCTWKHGRIAQ